MINSTISNSAMGALRVLSEARKGIETSQNRIATGLRIASPSDNAAYWSIATSMKSDSNALGVVGEALGLGTGVLDAASTGLEAVGDILSQMKEKLVAATQVGADRVKLQSEIKQLQAQMKGIATSSEFMGQNWLSTDTSAAGYTATKSFLATMGRDTNGAVTTTSLDVDVSSTVLYDARATGKTGLIDKDRTSGSTTAAVATLDISALKDNGPDQTTLQNYIKITDAALANVITATSNMGSAKARLQTQQNFLSELRGVMAKGISTLVDADMEEEAVRLKALQARERLAIEALAIANENSQSILRLFR